VGPTRRGGSDANGTAGIKLVSDRRDWTPLCDRCEACSTIRKRSRHCGRGDRFAVADRVRVWRRSVVWSGAAHWHRLSDQHSSGRHWPRADCGGTGTRSGRDARAGRSGRRDYPTASGANRRNSFGTRMVTCSRTAKGIFRHGLRHRHSGVDDGLPPVGPAVVDGGQYQSGVRTEAYRRAGRPRK
jgi:hypothetical protein